MPTTTPVITPTIAPTTTPHPWQEESTDPWETCPEQKRELGSPDVSP